MDKTRPIFERRLNGIRVAVWENVNGNDGKPWWNISLTRRFKDANEEWRDASTFNGLADLAVAKAAICLAQAFVEQRQEILSVTE